MIIMPLVTKYIITILAAALIRSSWAWATPFIVGIAGPLIMLFGTSRQEYFLDPKIIVENMLLQLAVFALVRTIRWLVIKVIAQEAEQD